MSFEWIENVCNGIFNLCDVMNEIFCNEKTNISFKNLYKN